MRSVPLSSVAVINPPGPQAHDLPPDQLVDFVPMSSVSENGTMAVAEHRPLSGVAKGFTAFRDGDVLIAKITPCFENNKIAVADVNSTYAFGSTEFHVVRCSSEVLDPRYLLHFLRQDRIRYAGERRMTGSAGQRRIPRQFVEELPIPLPALVEQRRIAAILDQADAVREKRRAALGLLERLPQALFEQMFGVPRAALTQWPKCTLADVVRHDDQINYGVVQPGAETDGGVPLVRVANLVANDFAAGSLKKIDPSIEAQYKRSRLRGDEILVACVGSIGAVALASPRLAGANIARAVARIRVDERKASRGYVSEFLRLPSTQRYFRSKTRAVAQPTLNIKQLAETPMVLPPLVKQEGFSDRVAEIARLRSSSGTHLVKLDALFASLQHRAFCGELVSKNAERELAMAG
jgi:type I restriction enzyme S subunit